MSMEQSFAMNREPAIQQAPTASTAVQVNSTDGAPWWVREARTYGLAGIFAGIACYGIKIVYTDNRAERAAWDAARDVRDVRTEAVITKNTEAFNGVKDNLSANNRALDELKQTLKETRR